MEAKKKVEIIHNPRCSKSRQAIEYLQDKDVEINVNEYLKKSLTEKELHKVLKMLNGDIDSMLRKNEIDYKANFKGKELSSDDIIKLMIQYPKTIQRPIVIHNNKAVIARPTEDIDKLFN